MTTPGRQWQRRVALLMPSLNEQSTVDAAMAAIRASSRQPDEIVVVDGGSTDGTHEMLAAHAAAGMPLRVLVRPGMLPGAARNEGARATDCDVLLFLDFGNVADARWIEAMAQPFEDDPEVEGAGGLFEPFMTNDFERCVAAIQYHDAAFFNRLPRSEQLARLPSEIRLGGLSMAVRRDVYLRLDGQPTWLRAGEDLLFGLKLLASRAKVAVALDACVFHHMRANAGELFRQNRLYSRGEARLGFGLTDHLRRAVVYGGALCALPLAIWGGRVGQLCAILPLLLLILHVYRCGPARMLRLYGVQTLRRHWATLLLAVVVKDVGSLAGYARGLAERLTQPHWRRRQRAYLQLP